jgi:broad specificity phosphatase PhoE
MEIVLVRHGKPASVPSDSIAGHEIGHWVRRYNDAGISREFPPPSSVQRLVASTGCVVASDLRRSVESADWLAAQREVRVDPDLREATLPESMGVAVRMPPGVWVVLARVAWWLNCGRATESIAATRDRASRVADRLCALAAAKAVVVVVGHGMFNRFVAAQLRSRGWRGPVLLPTAYWTAARFVKPTAPSRVRRAMTMRRL